MKSSAFFKPMATPLAEVKIYSNQLSNDINYQSLRGAFGSIAGDTEIARIFV